MCLLHIEPEEQRMEQLLQIYEITLSTKRAPEVLSSSTLLDTDNL